MTAFDRNRYARLRYRPVLLALMAVVLLVTSQWLIALGDNGQRGESIVIEVGGTPLTVEVADTPELVTRGLKYRDSLGWHEGMLFMFPEPKIQSFWMKDTRIDLDIGFFDRHGRLLNIAHMKAFDARTLHRSLKLAKYALEVNQGWFARNGISAGASLSIPEMPESGVPSGK
jgi:uncharacterized membrane protein (UPF0127 family)